MDPQNIARLYFKQQAGDLIVLNIPGTNYLLHLRPAGPVVPSPQGRVRGVVRLPVWKLDVVTAGGAFIEPVFGRPRRLQGKVVGVAPGNGVVVEVFGQPIVGQLPPRWNAAELAIGTRVGLDVQDGGVFEPMDPQANREPAPRGLTPVNLGAG